MYHNPHCTLVAEKSKSSGSLGRSSAVHSVTQLVVGNWTETKVDRDHCVLSLKNYSQFVQCDWTSYSPLYSKLLQCALYSLLKITLSLCDISYVYRISTGIISVVVVTSKRKDYSRIWHSGDNFVKSSDVVIILWIYWSQFQDRIHKTQKRCFKIFPSLFPFNMKPISLYALKAGLNRILDTILTFE